MRPTFLLQPDENFRLGEFLQSSLKDRRWTVFRAAIAFVKYSGTKHISQVLADFAGRSTVTISVMTLQRTDVGVGQVTKGTSKRSPEIFIPLSARDADPGFWGWPAQFTRDKRKRGKMDRVGVIMRIGTRVVKVNMMTWPDKHDFRLRGEYLRSAGNEGDILYIERADGSSGFTYYVEIIPRGTARHAAYLAKCSNAVRNSKRLWGYI